MAEEESNQGGDRVYTLITSVLPFALYVGGIVLWWGLRGRLWYRSTRHRWPCFWGTVLPKLPPHDSRCCCFKATPGSRKHRAVRVAPCFPHNPCAVCAHGCGCGFTDRELDLERHPCGLGLACKFGKLQQFIHFIFSPNKQNQQTKITKNIHTVYKTHTHCHI